MWIGRRNTEGHDPAVSRGLHGGQHAVAKRIVVLEVTVGRDHQQQRIGVLCERVTGGEGHGGSGVARCALEQNGAPAHADSAALFGDQEAMLLVAHDRGRLRGERLEPVQSLLEHRAAAGQRDELLGMELAGQGQRRVPEPPASTTGRMEVMQVPVGGGASQPQRAGRGKRAPGGAPPNRQYDKPGLTLRRRRWSVRSRCIHGGAICGRISYRSCSHGRFRSAVTGFILHLGRYAGTQRMADTVSHDHNFKNLIVDYPREALAFFAAEEAPGPEDDVHIVPLRQEQLKERLAASYRALDAPLLVKWADGRREAVVFALEEESDWHRFYPRAGSHITAWT